MTQRILFGAPADGEIFALGYNQDDDDGTFVQVVGSTDVFVPEGWWGEASHRTAVVIINSNAGLSCRLTPILDGVPLDGVSSDQDSRITFTVATPDSGGRRVISKHKIGLFQRIKINGTNYGRGAFRGTYVQFLLETLAAPTLPSGETVLDVRFDGVELDFTAQNSRQATEGPP